MKVLTRLLTLRSKPTPAPRTTMYPQIKEALLTERNLATKDRRVVSFWLHVSRSDNAAIIFDSPAEDRRCRRCHHCFFVVIHPTFTESQLVALAETLDSFA